LGCNNNNNFRFRFDLDFRFRFGLDFDIGFRNLVLYYLFLNIYFVGFAGMDDEQNRLLG